MTCAKNRRSNRVSKGNLFPLMRLIILMCLISDVDIAPYSPENTVTVQVTAYPTGLTCFLIPDLR